MKKKREYQSSELVKSFAKIYGFEDKLLALQVKDFLEDKGEIKENYKKVLVENGIEFEEKNHDEERILAADWVIKSPGVPKKAEMVQKIKAKGIRLSSEIEFGAEFTNAKIIF